MEQNEQHLLRGRRNASSKLGFFIHATAFALVNISRFAIHIRSAPSRIGAVCPFLGWGARPISPWSSCLCSVRPPVQIASGTRVRTRFQVPNRPAGL